MSFARLILYLSPELCLQDMQRCCNNCDPKDDPGLAFEWLKYINLMLPFFPFTLTPIPCCLYLPLCFFLNLNFV